MVDGKSSAFPVGKALYCADHKDAAEALLLAAEAARIEAAKPKAPPVPAVNTMPKLPPKLPAARIETDPTYETAGDAAVAESMYMAPAAKGTMISPDATYGKLGQLLDLFLTHSQLYATEMPPPHARRAITLY